MAKKVHEMDEFFQKFSAKCWLEDPDPLIRLEISSA